MWGARSGLLAAMLSLAPLAGALAPLSGALAQVPSLPGEERMEAALEAGETALAARNWSEAAARFTEAHAALPDALAPLLGLARAREGQARPLEAATWYRTYLAAALDPDETERQSLCRRVTALRAAHHKRTETAMALADKVIKAAATVIETAPPPEGGSRQAEQARLRPARETLEQVRRQPQSLSPDKDGLGQGIGVTEAWQALAGRTQWSDMEQSYRRLADRTVKPIERATSASQHAQLHVVLAATYDSLARVTDTVGRGCQP